jgi:hypothetical protein
MQVLKSCETIMAAVQKFNRLITAYFGWQFEQLRSI